MVNQTDVCEYKLQWPEVTWERDPLTHDWWRGGQGNQASVEERMSAARQTLCMARWLSRKPAASVDKPIGDDRSVQSKQFQVLCAKLVAALHPWNTLYISSANAQAAFQMTSKGECIHFHEDLKNLKMDLHYWGQVSNYSLEGQPGPFGPFTMEEDLYAAAARKALWGAGVNMAQLASKDPLEHIEAVTAWEYVAIHPRIPPALKRQVAAASAMPAVRLALERHVIEQIGQKADRQRAYEANWQSNLVPPDIYQHFRYAAYYTGVPASRDLNTWLKQ